MSQDETSGSVTSLVFSPEQIRYHAEFIKSRYSGNPAYAAGYLSELLENNGYGSADLPEVLAVKSIITELRNASVESPSEEHDGQWVVSQLAAKTDETEAEKALELVSKDIVFRKEIEEYYLPKQLVDAILNLGEIPKNTIETYVGIGFIDIADYTYLSKFLSPKENQVVLNGLYTAFNWVLRRHGGYLNKIEGDSLMFHFGGLIDPRIRGMEQEEVLEYIGKEIFYTCVEMQRVCVLFNQANDKFIYEEADKRTKEALKYAFDIISTLRNNLDLSSSMNALFQIRIRIGANIGLVNIGNFGPDGAKQWDVVGMPVIHAKRMEATAPIGGLRISEDLYKVLDKYGVVEAYFNRFKREALAIGGYFKNITREELFKFGKVVLKDKKNAEFLTYSIQVNPGLPESIAEQIKLLLEKGDPGADKILELLQYYRGNAYVINAVEDMFGRQ
ncbi:MAG: adenylate/guanylate cyclase domain-containing protein, partial [Spirochaetales bacterium]